MMEKMKKQRITAIVIVLALIAELVGFIVPTPVAASEASAEGEASAESTVSEVVGLTDVDGDKTFVTAKAILTDDIDLADRPWTPIGSLEEKGDFTGNHFAGIFDGNGKKITGLYVEAKYNDSGFFGEIRGATVKNFEISGEIVIKDTGIGFIGVIGAVCGETEALPNLGQSTVSGIVSHVNITADPDVSYISSEHIGGIAGYVNHESIIENCTWDGKITVDGTTTSNVGGIVGYIRGGSPVIKNCASYGVLIYGGTTGGYIVGKSQEGTARIENCVTSASKLFGPLNAEVSVENCYYLSNVEMDDISGTVAVSDYRMKSGEVAYQLGAAFGQTLDGGSYPVIGGAPVYYGYLSCASDAVAVYTNDAKASEQKPSHTQGTPPTLTEQATCRHCGESYGDLATTIPGDVDDDGTVNIVDIVAVIRIASGYEAKIRGNADLTGDGSVNVADIVAVVSIALNAS